MLKNLRTHLRHNAVGYLALFVALGGTSYAAVSLPRDSVGARQIRNDAVSSAEVKDRSLRARDFKAGQLPTGPTGPQGPAAFVAWGFVFDGFVQTDQSSSNVPADFIYKPPGTTGIYCTKSGITFGGRHSYFVTIAGNVPGYASVRNSSLAACGTSEYSPYITTYDASGSPADRNFYFGII